MVVEWLPTRRVLNLIHPHASILDFLVAIAVFLVVDAGIAVGLAEHARILLPCRNLFIQISQKLLCNLPRLPLLILDLLPLPRLLIQFRQQLLCHLTRSFLLGPDKRLIMVVSALDNRGQKAFVGL